MTRAFEVLTEPGHPLAGPLEALLDRVAADPLLAAGAPDGGEPLGVHRDVRAAPDADGRRRVTRFSWSVRWRLDGRFGARTLVYEAERGEPSIHDFPDDPRLPAAAEPDGPLAAPGAEVLRYIPLGRITFATGDAIGKILRPAALERSHAHLTAVAAAVRERAAFDVPAPLGLAGGAVRQGRVAGRPLRDALADGDAHAPMRRLGALQREIHELPVAGIRVVEPDGLAAAAHADAAWVAFAAPAHAAEVAELERRLARALDAASAAADGERRLCHGDLALDHVLLDGDRPAVIDFDDAALGDPYAELGATVALLPHEADSRRDGRSAIGEREVEAFLAGYAERAGAALDERRLRAHRARAELGLLARRLRKGRAGAEEVAATVARMRSGLARPA